MYYPPRPAYVAAYNPCVRYYAYPPYGWPAAPHYVAVLCYVPMVYAPAGFAGAGAYAMTVPREVEVDPASSPRQALVGGRSDVRLSLEYLVEAGAAAPEVKVTITSDGTAWTWTDTGIAEGYHVKENFSSAKPGAKVTFEATDAIARLRWCETICC